MDLLPCPPNYFVFALNDQGEPHRKLPVLAWRPVLRNNQINLVPVTLEGEFDRPILTPDNQVRTLNGIIVSLETYQNQHRPNKEQQP